MDRNELIKELHCHFPESFADGFEFSDIAVPSDQLLIILLFCPNLKGKRYSFAFELTPILNCRNMTNKAWITIENSKTQIISHYPNYKEFNHQEKTFHPYSVALSEYTGSAKNIKKICTNIYQGNIIHNE